MKKNLFLILFVFVGLFSFSGDVFAKSILFNNIKFDDTSLILSGNITNEEPNADIDIELYSQSSPSTQNKLLGQIPWEIGPFSLSIPSYKLIGLDPNQADTYVDSSTGETYYKSFIGEFAGTNVIFDSLQFSADDSANSLTDKIAFRIINPIGITTTTSGNTTTVNSNQNTNTSNILYISQPLVNPTTKKLSANIPASSNLTGSIFIDAIKTSGAAPTSESSILTRTNLGSTPNTSGDFFLSLNNFLMNDPLISNGSNDYNYLEISNSITSNFANRQYAKINFISAPQSTMQVDIFGTPSVVLKTDAITQDPYYNINGQFTRSEGEEVYLVLKRTSLSGGQSSFGNLCHYPASLSMTFGFYYGDEIVAPPLVAPIRCPGHPAALEPFSHQYSYSAYFSATSKGPAISDIINFPTIPVPVLENPIESLITNPKKSGSKNYYEVSGKVKTTKSGKQLSFNLIRLPDDIGGQKTAAGTLGVIPYTSGSFELLKNGIGAFPGVAPGSYLLEIRDNDGELVQEKILADIGDPTNVGGNGNYDYQAFVPTAEQKDIIDNGLVTTKCGYNLGPGKTGRICGFEDFVILIQRVIEYIFLLVLPIAAIVFAYAGFMYMTSQGDTGKLSAAKKAMTSLVIGIVVVMAAWLIVKTILVALGATAGFTMFMNF